MGKNQLSSHPSWTAALCHFILNHMLQPKFYRTPWTLFNSLTSQSIHSPDMQIFWYYHYVSQGLLWIPQGGSGTEPGLSPGGVLFRGHRVCLIDSDLSRRSSNNRSWNNITSCFHSSERGFLSSLLFLRLQLKRMRRQRKDTQFRKYNFGSGNSTHFQPASHKRGFVDDD